MNNTLIFVGMDTHKEFTEVAYALDGRDEHSQRHGKIPTTKQAISKLARQLQSKYPHATLHFVYGAGPCGYWVYRLLTSLGHCCYVAEPEDKAVRDLSRARDRAMHDLNDARYQLKAFLLRNNIRYDGPPNWSLKHPRKLMAYLGLIPSEYSSGEHQRRGSITKCGNTRARRLLVEGAHSYRYPPIFLRKCRNDKKACPKKDFRGCHHK